MAEGYALGKNGVWRTEASAQIRDIRIGRSD